MRRISTTISKISLTIIAATLAALTLLALAGRL